MYTPAPRIYLNPEPCDDESCPVGFYKMAGWEDTHCISKDGRIWSKINHKIMDMCSTLPKSKDKYKTFNSKYCVHRLLAETFLSKDHIPSYEPAVVNHIDGNKHNNVLDNIEWTTLRENSRHAKEIGLLKALCKVKIKNFYTNEEKEYISISDMLKDLNISFAVYSKYKHSDKTKNLLEGRFLVLREDEDEYPDYKPDPISREDENQGWMVIDRLRACTALFTTISDASRFMGYAIRYVYEIYKRGLDSGSHVFKIGKRFLCCPIKHHKQIVDNLINVNKYIKKYNKTSRPVRIKDLETGKFTFFNSLKEFSESINVEEPAMAVYLRKHKNKWKGKYKIKFLPRSKEKLADIKTIGK